ncbi:uncharacterized protein LOC116184991 [Apis dorsata]|uniref:uncharacterized protein LOC116184991 n=1 Tax=Apis dorsata TaxID=7462 RepID=UPI0012934315|nr:uncharacterized protein LOC116184991 [Apis dorsata]
MVELLIKTPKNLIDHVSVHPKSTTIDAKSHCKINVRLIPESNIITSSKRFYNPVSNILEFPIKVQILSQDSERPPPLIMKTIASLTPCNGLILGMGGNKSFARKFVIPSPVPTEPASIDLGFVHTHESVFAELTLTNESLLIQEYAFIDLPLSADIQPNNFGFILPGETIKLHLIYSPCPMDIPGNKIGANGLAGQRRFLVEVFTLAELAGKKKQSMLNQLKSRMNKQMTIFEYRGIPPPFHVNLKKSKIVRQLIDRDNNNKLKDNTELDEANDKHPCEEEDKKRLLDDTMEMYDLDERKQKNLIEVYAYIIDTFCELSEQIIQFPATPCGSYSMVSVHLRGFNLASYPYCTCGIIKEQRKKFTGCYEFTSSSNRMTIMPHSGILQNDEIININFMFKPKLPKKMIFEEGLRLKMNTEELNENQEKKVEEPEIDMSAGEISLLEVFEPCVSTIFVTCVINIETKIGAKHDERLFAKLICPIIKPEIVILNGDRVIEFEPTAIGMSSRKFLFVKNISTQ